MFSSRPGLKYILGAASGAWALAVSGGAASAVASPPVGGPPAIDLGAKQTDAAVSVIFTGFARAADRSSRVFVRMTGEVPVEPTREGRRLTYHLAGAKLGVANNANPLPTSHFGPPVKNVSLVPGEAGVDLIIELSEDPSAEQGAHRLVAHGELATLHVSFPAASR